MKHTQIQQEIADLHSIGHRLEYAQNTLAERIDNLSAHLDAGKTLHDPGCSNPLLPALVSRLQSVTSEEEKAKMIGHFLTSKIDRDGEALAELLMNLGYELAILGNMEHYSAHRLEADRDLAVAKATRLTKADHEALAEQNGVIKTLIDIGNIRSMEAQSIDTALSRIMQALTKAGQADQANEIRDAAQALAAQACAFKDRLYNAQVKDDEVDETFITMTLATISRYCEMVESKTETAGEYVHLYCGLELLKLSEPAHDFMKEHLLEQIRTYYRSAERMAEVATFFLERALNAHEVALENNINSMAENLYGKPFGEIRPS